MIIGDYRVDFRLMMCMFQDREYHMMHMNGIMYIGTYVSWMGSKNDNMSWHYPGTQQMGKRLFEAYVMWQLEKELWPDGESIS